MAPFGDVAPALVACRAAAEGGSIDVVAPLVVAAVAGVVEVDHVLWAEVDGAGGRIVAAAAHPGPEAPSDVAAFAAHVARQHDAPVCDDGRCLVLGAGPGHRAGIVLRRPTALAAGEQARLDTVVPALACALLAAPRPPPVGPDLLTRREVVVLRTVATGLSDKQVARHLGVSPRTVGKHLEHIYAKLGVAGRTEAARVWSER